MSWSRQKKPPGECRSVVAGVMLTPAQSERLHELVLEAMDRGEAGASRSGVLYRALTRPGAVLGQRPRRAGGSGE